MSKTTPIIVDSLDVNQSSSYLDSTPIKIEQSDESLAPVLSQKYLLQYNFSNLSSCATHRSKEILPPSSKEKACHDLCYQLALLQSKSNESSLSELADEVERGQQQKNEDLAQLNREKQDLRNKQASEKQWETASRVAQFTLVALGLTLGLATGGAASVLAITATAYIAARHACKAFNLNQRFVYWLRPGQTKSNDKFLKHLEMTLMVADIAAMVALTACNSTAFSFLSSVGKWAKVKEMIATGMSLKNVIATGAMALQASGFVTEAGASVARSRYTYARANIDYHSAQHEAASARQNRLLQQAKQLEEMTQQSTNNFNNSLNNDHDAKLSVMQ